jgi:hypothetical protein
MRLNPTSISRSQRANVGPDGLNAVVATHRENRNPGSTSDCLIAIAAPIFGQHQRLENLLLEQAGQSTGLNRHNAPFPDQHAQDTIRFWAERSIDWLIGLRAGWCKSAERDNECNEDQPPRPVFLPLSAKRRGGWGER